MLELKTHPKFSKALRPLESDEYERLSLLIEAEGCRVPIDLWNEYIIDGHNRYKICRETGQGCKTVDRTDDFENELDVLIWIKDNALAGRNMDFADKKSEIGDLYNLLKQRDEDRVKRLKDKNVLQGDTSENIGLRFGVSGKTVRRYGTEMERQKVLKELAEVIRKKAVSEGWSEDEDRMQTEMDGASQSLQFEDESEAFETAPDDYNQGEPTDEERQAARAASPFKRSKSKSKSMESQRKNALKGYEFALGKIQGFRLDLLFGDGFPLPDFKACYEGIERERAKFSGA
jgi:hypothetical protein